MKASVFEMEGLLRGKCVPAKMLVNESLSEYLVRQFDALYERAEKAERERDELRAELKEYVSENFELFKLYLDERCGKLPSMKDSPNTITVRLKDLKENADIARSDAAAGEPVGLIRENPDDIGLMAEFEVMPPAGTKLYTAAQPAVFPPEKITEIMQGAWNEFCDDTGCYPDDFEYQNEQLFFDAGRWAMLVAERISSMGAQQQKVVELHKRKSTEVISGQRYSYVLLEDLLPELDAAGVKWEVKK